MGSGMERRRLQNGWETGAEIARDKLGLFLHGKKKTGSCLVRHIAIPQTQEEYQAAAKLLGTNDSALVNEYFKNIALHIQAQYDRLKPLQGIKGFDIGSEVLVQPRQNQRGFDVFIFCNAHNNLMQSCKNNGVQNYQTKLMSEQDIIRLGTDICNILAASEQKNIVFRHIIPENILWNETCFSLSNVFVPSAWDQINISDIVNGFDLYLPPEAVVHGEMNQSVDTYSLGMVMYRLCNRNTLPFLPADQESNPTKRSEALVRRVCGERLAQPNGISSSLWRIIQKACAQEVKDRYHSSSEMLADLKSIKPAEKQPVQPKQPVKAPQPVQPVKTPEKPKPTPPVNAPQHAQPVKSSEKQPSAQPQQHSQSDKPATTVQPAPKKKKKGKFIVVLLVLFMLGIASLYVWNQYGTTPIKHPWICLKCGHLNAIDNNFCENCDNGNAPWQK